MRTKARKLIAAGLSLLLVFLCASCSFQNKEVAMKLFKNRDKISYSSKYYALKDTGTNKAGTWREGMVSGNGEIGFVTSGAPFSDSMIFQNVHFVMPNGGERETPDTAAQLEDIRSAVVAGTPVSDDAGAAGSYSFHPGGALRIISDGSKAKKYIRYTDYETGEVGVNYSDEFGAWERKSFTSMADNAVITRISCLSGAKTTVLLSFDDISTIANFGTGNEVDAQVKTLVDDDASYIAFLGHYPDYENSPLSDSGWLTFTYVLPEGGVAERVTLNREERAPQDVSDAVYGIRVSDAYAVNLITLTRRVENLGSMDDFAGADNYKAIKTAESDASKLQKQYLTDGDFDYEQALKAHDDIYSDQFGAVSLTLEEAKGLNSNEALVGSQKHKKELNASYMLRAYYAGRYAMLCCAGEAGGRSTGLWTGEFNPDWGGVYGTEDLCLQTAAFATANIKSSPVGYASMLLRQAPDWLKNAKATHGFDNAVQAPAMGDGETGLLLDSGTFAPYRYWNAGAALLLRPLYEAVLAFGDLEIPITEDMDLDDLKSVLSVTDQDADDEFLNALADQGHFSLLKHILLPLLVKTANYWVQMADPAYYTDADGGIHHEPGKTSLAAEETYCLLPGYTYNGTPENYGSAVTANTAVDIAACRDTITMLMDVIDLTRLSNSKPEKNANEALRGDAGSINTKDYLNLLSKLPAYQYDAGGSVKPWAVADYRGIGQDNALAHLACAWPFAETRTDSDLWDAGTRTIQASELTETHGGALARRALLAARLKDRSALTQALLTEESRNLRYTSFMTNAATGGRDAYNVSAAIGFTAAVNEGLLYSAPGQVELLPCVPESGFNVGSISGLRTKNNATITLMSWDLRANFVIADVTSDVNQTITFTCPFSSDSQEVELQAGKTTTISLDLDLTPEDLAPASDDAAPAERRDMSALPEDEEQTTEAEETTVADEDEDENEAYAYDYDDDSAEESSDADTSSDDGGYSDYGGSEADDTENDGGSGDSGSDDDSGGDMDTDDDAEADAMDDDE